MLVNFPVSVIKFPQKLAYTLDWDGVQLASEIDSWLLAQKQ